MHGSIREQGASKVSLALNGAGRNVWQASALKINELQGMCLGVGLVGGDGPLPPALQDGVGWMRAEQLSSELLALSSAH